MNFIKKSKYVLFLFIIMSLFIYSGSCVLSQIPVSPNGGIIKVSDSPYGAKCDNETDDTSSIQKAFDSAAQYGKAIIEIPAGTCKVKNVTLKNADSVTITGPGELKSIAGDQDYGLIRIYNSKNIRVDGISITGRGIGSSDIGLFIDQCHNCVIQNTNITRFSSKGISAWGSLDSIDAPNLISNNLISDNYIGISFESNAQYYDISTNRITKNEFGLYGGFGNTSIRMNQVTNNKYGAVIDSGLNSNPDHSSISGNKFNHNQAIGLKISNVKSGWQVIDNQILSNIGPDVYPTTGKSHSLVLENVRDLSFIGNRVDSGGSYIRIYGHTESRYIGNTFQGDVVEDISGKTNLFSGNRFDGINKLLINRQSTDTIRSNDIENGKFVNAHF